MAFYMSGPAAALSKMKLLVPATLVINNFLNTTTNTGRSFSSQQISAALQPVLEILLAPALAAYPTFSINTFTGAAAGELARNNPQIIHTQRGKTHFFRA